jgi:hypothetical protein
MKSFFIGLQSVLLVGATAALVHLRLQLNAERRWNNAISSYARGAESSWHACEDVLDNHKSFVSETEDEYWSVVDSLVTCETRFASPYGPWPYEDDASLVDGLADCEREMRCSCGPSEEDVP